MDEQQKIFRVLRLISLLADKPNRTVIEIAKVLETSAKTIYRYLQLLESIGYHIDKDQRNAYFLFESETNKANTFEPQELILLNQLLGAVEIANPLRESIKKKLYLSSNLIPLADELIDKHSAKIVQRLSDAIENKRQCMLLRYHSATSETPTERFVEPICFAKNNSILCAFDVNKQAIRHFKIKRIEDVNILNSNFLYNHEIESVDIFGLQSDQIIQLKLLLSIRAFQLLVEEFPEARKYIKKNQINSSYPYRFVYEARSLVGIGRFVLGLPGEILIESPNEFKEYLKMKIDSFLLS
jgi:proteasome accessory factor C